MRSADRYTVVISPGETRIRCPRCDFQAVLYYAGPHDRVARFPDHDDSRYRHQDESEPCPFSSWPIEIVLESPQKQIA